mgnify:CR=1 FL=1
MGGLDARFLHSQSLRFGESFNFGSLRSTFLEFFHSSGRINNFILTREKRVTGAANFNMKFRQGRADSESGSARTSYGGGIISGMNIRFHLEELL